MKPPAIKMLTPNGRFRTGTRLCLSISGNQRTHARTHHTHYMYTHNVDCTVSIVRMTSPHTNMCLVPPSLLQTSTPTHGTLCGALTQSCLACTHSWYCCTPPTNPINSCTSQSAHDAGVTHSRIVTCCLCGSWRTHQLLAASLHLTSTSASLRSTRWPSTAGIQPSAACFQSWWKSSSRQTRRCVARTPPQQLPPPWRTPPPV